MTYLLGLLDLGAAFDYVDRDIGLVLSTEFIFGIWGVALSWIQWFLHGRTQQVSCVNGIDSWRTTRLSAGPVAVSLIHWRAVWCYRQCWFNCALIMLSIGLHRCTSVSQPLPICINHCTALRFVLRAYWIWFEDEQQPRLRMNADKLSYCGSELQQQPVTELQ